MTQSIIPEELIRLYCQESYSIADFCRKCNWKPKGGNYKTFHKYVKMYNLDTSHFTGKASNIGNKYNVGITDAEMFSDRNIEVKGSTLLNRLINAGYKKYQCEVCKITEYNNKHIKLLIHHIDGNHTNNSLDNLLLLCPNCHSLTDSYAGKKNLSGIRTTIYERQPKYVCSICGKKLLRLTKTGLCRECYNKQYKK